MENKTTSVPVNFYMCPLFQDDSSKCEILVIVKRVSASLSLVGALFTLLLISLFKKYREPSQRMIAHLSLAAFLYSISYMVDDIHDHVTWKCRFQGAFITMLVCVCFLWIMCILFNLYFMMLFQFDFRKYEIIVTLICWLLPFLLACLPFTDDAYGPSGAWCWIENDFGWRFGLWYIWRILFVVVFVVVMVHIHYKLYILSRNRHDSPMALSCFESDTKTLRVYPIVYFVLNIFPILNRMHQAVHGNRDHTNYNFILLLFQTIADPAFGGTIAVLYTLDSRTRQLLKPKSLLSAFQNWSQKGSQIKEYSGSSSIEMKVPQVHDNGKSVLVHNEICET